MDTHLFTADRAELLQLIEQQGQTIARQGQTIAQQEQLIAQLQAELAALRATGLPRDTPASGSESAATHDTPAFVKPNRPQRAKGQPRKKRAKGYARRRAQPTQRVEHALDRCPDCGCAMRGGAVKRTREVLHVPLVPVQVIEHVFIERRCPQCGKRHRPKPQEVLADVVGRHRLSTTTMALIAALREVGRWPVQTICWYLETFHALTLSVGEVVEVLHAVAKQAAGTVQRFLAELRASPVVHADETTWREEGQNGYIWVFSTPRVRYFLRRASRSGEIVNEVLGADFGGTLVSDFYGGYNRMAGQHQRCWAHLLRDVHELQEQWPAAPAVQTWTEQVHAFYQRATDYGVSHAGAKATERVAQQHALEQELLALARPYLEGEHPQRTLCQRIEHFLPELFTFIADPRVPSDNNAAERSIRPLAVSRKISGGTRSAQGSDTAAVLATIFGTWLVRLLNPFTACCRLLAPM